MLKENTGFFGIQFDGKTSLAKQNREVGRICACRYSIFDLRLHFDG